MAGFKTYWSSLKYHTITQPSIHAVKKLSVKLGSKFADKLRAQRHAAGKGRKPGLRQAVMAKTRGAASTSKSLFSKGTVTGQKRRMAAAAAIRAKTGRTFGAKRPASHTAPAAKTASSSPVKMTPHTPASHAKFVQKAYGLNKRSATPAPKASPAAKPTKMAPNRKNVPTSVQGALAASKTHGQLRRRLTGLAVRSVTSRAVHASHGPQSRKQIADQVRGLRMIPGTKDKLRQAVRSTRNRRIRSAAKALAGPKKS